MKAFSMLMGRQSTFDVSVMMVEVGAREQFVGNDIGTAGLI
jgi:hypothetical protein